MKSIENDQGPTMYEGQMFLTPDARTILALTLLSSMYPVFRYTRQDDIPVISRFQDFRSLVDDIGATPFSQNERARVNSQVTGIVQDVLTATRNTVDASAASHVFRADTAALWQGFVEFSQSPSGVPDYSLDPLLVKAGLRHGINSYGSFEIRRLNPRPVSPVPGFLLSDLVISPGTPDLRQVHVPRVTAVLEERELLSVREQLSIGRTTLVSSYDRISPPVIYPMTIVKDGRPDVNHTGAISRLASALHAGASELNQLSTVQFGWKRVPVGSGVSEEITRIPFASPDRTTITRLSDGHEYSEDEISGGQHFGQRNRYEVTRQDGMRSVTREYRTDHGVEVGEIPLNLLYLIRHTNVSPQTLLYITLRNGEVPKTLGTIVRDMLVQSDMKFLWHLGNVAEQSAQASRVAGDAVSTTLRKQGIGKRLRNTYRAGIDMLYAGWPIAYTMHYDRMRGEYLAFLGEGQRFARR
jgi:hypothetical protein